MASFPLIVQKEARYRKIFKSKLIFEDVIEVTKKRKGDLSGSELFESLIGSSSQLKCLALSLLDFPSCLSKYHQMVKVAKQDSKDHTYVAIPEATMETLETPYKSSFLSTAFKRILRLWLSYRSSIISMKF